MIAKARQKSIKLQTEQRRSGRLVMLFSGLMVAVLWGMLVLPVSASIDGAYGSYDDTSTYDVSKHDTDKSRQCFTDANQAYAYLLAQQAQQQREQQAERDRVLVNINTATEGELTALDGIGSSKARAIIVYRQAFGKFASVDELTRVKGIGEKTLEQNRQRLTVQ